MNGSETNVYMEPSVEKLPKERTHHLIEARVSASLGWKKFGLHPEKLVTSADRFSVFDKKRPIFGPSFESGKENRDSFL